MSYRPKMRGKGSSPRVVFRNRLRIAKTFIESNIRTIDHYSGQVYVPHDKRAPGDPYLRPRGEGEWMEEQPKVWRSLASDFDMMATYFANEARNARSIANMIEETGECPRIENRVKR